MKTLQCVWIVEVFNDEGSVELRSVWKTREEARIDSRFASRYVGHKTRIVKFIRSEG